MTAFKTISKFLVLLSCLLAAIETVKTYPEILSAAFSSASFSEMSSSILSVGKRSESREEQQRRTLEALERYEQKLKESADQSKVVSFWVKLGFSLVFGGSALFIVLSKRYSAETERWAFGILSLIAGVWIGTAV
jgi:hypothetical protein